MKLTEYLEVATSLEGWSIQQIDQRKLTPKDYLLMRRNSGRVIFVMPLGHGDARYFFTTSGDKNGTYTFVEMFNDYGYVTVQFHEAKMKPNGFTSLAMKNRNLREISSSASILSGVAAAIKHYSENNSDPMFAFVGVKPDDEGSDQFSTSKRTSLYTRMMKRLKVKKAWSDTKDRNSIMFTMSSSRKPSERKMVRIL